MEYKEIFVGTYIDTDSCSVYKAIVDFQQKKIELDISIDAGPNPSCLAMHSTKEYLYAINELSMHVHKKCSNLVCLKRDSQGSYVPHSVHSTKGDNACHISLSKDETYLFVANYGSVFSQHKNGSLSVFSLDEEGAVQELVQELSYTGHSTHPERQEKAHIHASISSKDGHYLFVSDLGSDCMYQYKIKNKFADNGPPLMFLDTIKTPRGNGPRHMDWDDTCTYLYVSCELSSSVCVYAFYENALHFVQDISVFPAESTPYPRTSTSEIAYYGGYVYMANRGDDSLAVFAVQETGMLKYVHTVPVLGKTPRNFKIIHDGNSENIFLILGHQDSNSIALFSIHTYRLKFESLCSNVQSPVYFSK